MSAIPEQAYRPSKVSNYLYLLNERTDDALLSDDEVYSLKGGNSKFFTKMLFGFGTVGAYLLIRKKHHEVLRFEISRSTFLMSNFLFFMATLGFQLCYNISSGNETRLRLHQAALYQRFLLNYKFMLENKKKPKVH